MKNIKDASIRTFDKEPERFIKGFWQQKLLAVYETFRHRRPFFFGENMKLKQLNIVVDNNEICMHQEIGGSDNFVAITPEMVDLVCNELQILKNKLEADAQEKK